MIPERALIERAYRALCGEFTTAGHYALKNDREHRGGCSPRRCQTPCVLRIDLLEDLVAYLDEHPEDETRQLALIEVTAR